MKKKIYEKHREKLAAELLAMQRWLIRTGQRVVVLFEGRDTAGKGGTIKAISEYLDTKGYRIVALTKPTPRESSQWYFQRYIAHLPSAGEIVLFDRSWYNRAVVEKVMDFCTHAQYKLFLAQCKVFERMLVDDGILLYKYWLAVDQAKQEERFAARATDPLKHWKISPVDIASRDKYNDYSKARDAMLAATHTRHAPWHVVDFNDQPTGRLNLIRDLLDRLPDHKLPFKPLELPPLKHKPGVEKLHNHSLWVKEVY